MITVLTPASSYALTTLAVVKAELQLTVTTSDDLITTLINHSSAEISGYCKRVFGLETVRQSFAYSKEQSLWLARVPVIEIDTITDSGTALVDGTDFRLDPTTGELTRIGIYGWYDGWRYGAWEESIIVEYSGGYDLPDEVPGDLERAAIELVKWYWFSRARDPLLRSEEVPGILSQSFSAAVGVETKRGLPMDVAHRLDRFVSFAL